ncbi:hypothetical protein [Agromyces mediolanus]|uniref:hypothetical protein n=1 Tax=Agromyces mediolanus TaxID=41986 RepID=UPI001E552592|nr:hypothetical protein [Agromyces mediolanus]MCD1571387.1 hypothetical protein [Agromyces mediolanus]
MAHSRIATFAGAIAAAVLLLTACAPPAPSPSPSSTPTSSAGSTPPASEEASPTPTETATPATCDTVLTAEAYAKLDADGLTFRADDAGTALAPVLPELVADGALHCKWAKPSSDIAAWYAQLPEDDASWAARSEQLEASGWTVGDAPVAGTLLAPADYDASFRPALVHVDGITVFASYADFLTSSLAVQG